MSDIKVFKKACTLTFEFDRSETTYGFLVNQTAGEFSDITKVNGIATYEVDSDGVYKFFLIDSPNLTIGEDSKSFRIGYYEWTIDRYANAAIAREEGNSTIIADFGKFSIKSAFCSCKLQKCLLNLQMKVFNELAKSCGQGCKNLDSSKSQRDFLFIANWLMEHLEEYDRFDELMNIYEGIQSCNSLCNELVKNNKCGCNG